jgi:hypothetical protein
MDTYPDNEEFPENSQLSVAAALHLLSVMGTHGANATRCAALLRHLNRLSWDTRLAHPLRCSCSQLHAVWKQILCSICSGDPDGEGVAESFDSMPRPPESSLLH